MAYLSPSAAYVRKDEFIGRSVLKAEDIRGSVVEEQVWQLLETPQTIESLRRAARESAAGGESLVDRGDIEKMLERLLDADLIEMSPDS